MKLIHTADWHLGRPFHATDLSSLQEEFLEWLADLVAREEADAVLMAGDIYDRALPSVAAVEAFRRGVTRLAEVTQLVMITGNHDSTKRMGLGPLMRPEITLRAGVEEIGTPALLGNGEAPVAVYPIPYLDPMVDAAPLGAGEQSHESVLAAALERCREDLAARPPGTRSAVVAHAFVAGGAVSESERTLAVGGAEQVPSALFEGFDYVALGHLHRPQDIEEAIAYSGSPLPYSFSEVDGGSKSVEVVELEGDAPPSRRRVEVPAFKPVARIEGELEQLLDDPDLRRYEDHWLEITLTDESRPMNAMDRLRDRFPGTLSLRFAHDPAARTEEGAERFARLTQRDPYRLAADFLEHVRGEAPRPEEEPLLREAIARGDPGAEE